MKRPPFKQYIPAIFLALLAAACFSAGLFSGQAEETDLGSRFLEPSSTHLLGTDELGRDVFVRLLYGGQVSLAVAAIAGLLAAVVGTTVGMVAGYAGGKWDALLMRITDVMISLPALPLLIILSAVDLSKLGIPAGEYTNLWKIIAIISLLSWTTVARLARARMLVLKETDFVRAAKALGVSHARILLRHIFPNLLGTIVVATTLATGNIILTESVLSFLGLGIQPPLPSWGNMLSHAARTIWEHAEMTFYPGIMIFATVLAFNYLGDALQSRFDPKAKTGP
ncbi:MAG: ABC transporter permease [Alphaproteobacteria bacterium]